MFVGFHRCCGTRVLKLNCLGSPGPPQEIGAQGHVNAIVTGSVKSAVDTDHAVENVNIENAVGRGTLVGSMKSATGKVGATVETQSGRGSESASIAAVATRLQFCVSVHTVFVTTHLCYNLRSENIEGFVQLSSHNINLIFSNYYSSCSKIVLV